VFLAKLGEEHEYTRNAKYWLNEIGKE
jgi:hypothetical protein